MKISLGFPGPLRVATDSSPYVFSDCFQVGEHGNTDRSITFAHLARGMDGS